MEKEEQEYATSTLRPLFNVSAASLEEPIHPRYDSIFANDIEEDWKSSLEAWEPFVALIPKFQHLADIVVKFSSGSNGLPPGLLPAIEKHHPRCRLHLSCFRFKSLSREVTDPDEHALVTSPNLHSMSIMHQYRLSNGETDHNEAAALRTVALAPNLKHVRMLCCIPASSSELHQVRDLPLDVWKGFSPPIDGPEGRKARLKSLAFVGYGENLNIQKLATWYVKAFQSYRCSSGHKSIRITGSN